MIPIRKVSATIGYRKFDPNDEDDGESSVAHSDDSTPSHRRSFAPRIAGVTYLLVKHCTFPTVPIGSDDAAALPVELDTARLPQQFVFVGYTDIAAATEWLATLVATHATVVPSLNFDRSAQERRHPKIRCTQFLALVVYYLNRCQRTQPGVFIADSVRMPLSNALAKRLSQCVRTACVRLHLSSPLFPLACRLTALCTYSNISSADITTAMHSAVASIAGVLHTPQAEEALREYANKRHM